MEIQDDDALVITVNPTDTVFSGPTSAVSKTSLHDRLGLKFEIPEVFVNSAQVYQTTNKFIENVQSVVEKDRESLAGDLHDALLIICLLYTSPSPRD